MTTPGQASAQERAAPTTSPLTPVNPSEGGDPVVRGLLEGYVQLAASDGAALLGIEGGLYELTVPTSDRLLFRNQRTVRIALAADALERDPEAEIAVVGSVLVTSLISAIRQRGTRCDFGALAPDHSSMPRDVQLNFTTPRASVGAPAVTIASHRAVRLLVRAVVRTGGEVEEHLLESALYDATTGIALPADIAERCPPGSPATETLASARDSSHAALAGVSVAPSRPMAELVPLILSDLKSGFEPTLRRFRIEAARSLAHEVGRIDRYYTSLLEGAAGRGSEVPTGEARRVIEAEHARRRQEEQRRHQVSVTVHPVQLTEWTIPMQRVEWPLRAAGVSGRLRPDAPSAHAIAQRPLVGAGAWIMACPTCGETVITELAVCTHSHITCQTCALECSVCEDVFCWDHGLAACHVDGRPACQSHARHCRSCDQPYCAGHEDACQEGEHPTCSECLVACAVCRREVCRTHGSWSRPDAPLGSRWLCQDCVVCCEGGQNEPVGADEVVRCASCDRHVCTRHQATCVVDGLVHCSTHLRRSDASRRLVCERHRTSCDLERESIVPTDEIGLCTQCGRRACHAHQRTCAEDGLLFCADHVVPLADRPGAFGCGAHHAGCSIDGQAYAVASTRACPVCDRTVCKSHTRACDSCGRTVCTSDVPTGGSVCRTCQGMTRVTDVPEAILRASLSADIATGRGRWRLGRDAHHLVAEVDLGWFRRVVIAVRHGDDVFEVGIMHSPFGRTPLRR